MTSAVRVPADLEQQLRDLEPTCDAALVRNACPKHALLALLIGRPRPDRCPQPAAHVIHVWCGTCGYRGRGALICAEHGAVLQRMIDEGRVPACACGGGLLNVHLDAL